MRRSLSVFCVCCALAAPAAAELPFLGEPEYGVRLTDSGKCLERDKVFGNCPDKITDSGKNSPLGRLFTITGEARMGLVYDGERLNPRSEVEITIRFGTVADNGLRIGASRTIASN